MEAHRSAKPDQGMVQIWLLALRGAMRQCWMLSRKAADNDNDYVAHAPCGVLTVALLESDDPIATG